MTRSALDPLGALLLLAGCTPAASTVESKDWAECKEYARSFEHCGRMKDARLISRGYTVSYSTIRAASATRDGSSSSAA